MSYEKQIIITYIYIYIWKDIDIFIPYAIHLLNKMFVKPVSRREKVQPGQL